MTLKLKTLLTATFFLAIPLSGWALYRANINLSGKCETLGRALTVAEKRTKLVGFLQDDYAEKNPRNNSSIVQTIFSRTLGDYPGGKDFSITILNKANENSSDFWVYPDVPEYSLDGKGDYDKSAFKSNRNLDRWEPVTFWYRSTGYASDLVFLDLNMTGTYSDGRVVPKKYDFRAWINSCGQLVELPEEFWEQ